VAKNNFTTSVRLLKAGGLGVMAVALAALAVPASAQDRGHGQGHGRWSGGSTAQSGGNWSGRNWNRGASAQSGGSSVTARSWSDNPEGGQWRQRGSNSAARDWSGGDGSNRRGRNVENEGTRAGNTAGTDWSERRAARAAELQRRRESAQSWSNQNQWSNNQFERRNRSYSDPDRNRSYSDPDRNRTYERDRSRGSNHGDTWRNDGSRRDNDRWDGNRWRNDGRRWDGNRWSHDSARRWNREWRRDNRYDWYSYRSHNRDRFRLGRYYAPYRNYSYRRLGIGIYLDSLFFGSRYWIDDPWYYRLPPADGPYRWIRYYDDALLVDIYTGEVIDVIYDFFW